MANRPPDNQLEALLLGAHVRHARREAAMTLAELSEAVGKPSPYLSQLENGKVEPRLNVLNDIARALGVATQDFFALEPPDSRSALELAVHRAQADPSYRALGLEPLKISSKMPDEFLRHIVALHEALPDQAAIDATEVQRLRASDRARAANLTLRDEMRERGNYFHEIELVATKALAAVGYQGRGPVNEKLLTDLAAHFGFGVERTRGMPRTARSITDTRRRVIYIADRDDLHVRAARSVVLQTLGHFALDHTETTDFPEYLRQRVESNYFAAAVLAPEKPAVEFLHEQKDRNDLSIEDLKELFYISYEMAAHRFTNLATEHLDLPMHFLRTDMDGVITKAYENDGVPFPRDPDGALEGMRVGRKWGARQAWNNTDSFLLHYQHSQTDVGGYWCVTYIETVTDRTPFAITLGTDAQHSAHFRGGDTLRRQITKRADNVPDPVLVDRWEGVAWPSASERSHILTALPPAGREFNPFPGVDVADVYRFLERQTG